MLAAGTKHLFGAVIVLVSVGHASGQRCVSASSVKWHPCGTDFTSVGSCDQASNIIYIRRLASCDSSNPVVTVDYAGPIAVSGIAYGGDGSQISIDPSDDKTSFTLDVDASDLEQAYNEVADFYYFYLELLLDNCDTGYSWSDNFAQLSYVDDENNAIDMTWFNDPVIDGPDNGACAETPSPAAVSQAPTLAPTMPDDDTSFSFSFEGEDEDDDRACVSAFDTYWYPCGMNDSCEEVYAEFFIRRELDCVSSNPIVTVDFAGPIAIKGSVTGDSSTDMLVEANPSDLASITFDIGEYGLDPYFNPWEDSYYGWRFFVFVNACDTSGAWNDNFLQLSYTDDENNTVDMSAFGNPETAAWSCRESPWWEVDDATLAPTVPGGDMSFSFSFDW